MLFDWLRNTAKNAVLAGIGDAVKELHTGTEEQDESIAYLRATMAAPKALPAPSPAEETKGKRTTAKA